MNSQVRLGKPVPRRRTRNDRKPNEHNREQAEGGYLMKRALAGTFLAATFAVGLSAQSTTPPQSTTPQAQPPMQESKDAAKTITVTGCLKAGDTADSFILSDLKWSNKDKPAGAVGTSGAGAPPAMASATTLKVIPGSTKLSEHVGHTVEVTGTVSAKAPSASPATPADPASSRAASAGPSIDARSVKMVSATCTP
jgi:hypothetical protein